MNCNFPRYSALSDAGQAEACSRNTDPAVWLAINLLVDSMGGARGANEVWENPTPAEWDWVRMCLGEWALHSDIKFGDFCWGDETITVEA